MSKSDRPLTLPANSMHTISQREANVVNFQGYGIFCYVDISSTKLFQAHFSEPNASYPSIIFDFKTLPWEPIIGIRLLLSQT